MTLPRSPPPRPLSFPHPQPIYPPDWEWQMQDHPGAPGTARQGRTRIIVSTNDGGKATQPRAPGHGRPLAAQRAARHGRLSADSGAPGADVPLAVAAGAPGQHCLSAALRAPGHERPLAAPRAVDYHWSGARHPQVPGQGRFPTAQRAAGHGRLSAASPAPGHDVPLAVTAGAPGHDCLSATPIATAPLPAHVRRLLQVTLPRVPATPDTLIYPPSQQNTANNRAASSHTPTYPQSRSTASSFRRQETGVKSSFPRKRESKNRPSQVGNDGATATTARSTTHQVHPAIQVPPRPRPCFTAGTGFPLQHPSRAPPPRHCGGSRNPAPQPVIPAKAGI